MAIISLDLDKKTNKVNIVRFPALLRNKLTSGELAFPAETEWQYAPLKAYRCITRENDVFDKAEARDFLSYVEEGKTVKKKAFSQDDTGELGRYSVSFFCNRARVVNAMKLPRPKKRIIAGMIKQEGGPRLINHDTTHVHWWLYDGYKVEGFVIEGGTNGR